MNEMQSGINITGHPNIEMALILGITPHSIDVRPIPKTSARDIIIRHHYSRSWPAGTKLAFGAFLERKLLGVATFGVGPFLGYSLVENARPDDAITLTRFWLSDSLPRNSESHVLALILRSLHRYTSLKFVITYSDPGKGHYGTIYQATGWLYTGLSSATPLYKVAGGAPRHSRSFAAAFGSHSIEYFTAHDIPLLTIPQSSKFRYIYFLDPSWSSRIRVAVLPYPKKEAGQ